MSFLGGSSARRFGAPAQVAGALLMILFAVAIQARSGLNHDVAWYLQVASSIEKGIPYYVDRPGSYLEINPPLVVWTLLPPLWISRRLAWSMTIAPVLLISFELLLAAVLTGELLRRTSGGRAFLWGLLVAGLLVVGPEFGQREHQVVLLLFPALVSLVLLPDSSRLSPWLRVGVGVSAGVGIALKPHFVVAWALVELVCAAYDRRPKQLARMEILVAAGVVMGYAVCVLVFAPGYLPLLREWGPLYLRWLRTPITILLVQPEFLVATLVLLLAIRVRAAGRAGRAALVFGVMGFAFAIMVLAQGKGFTYHWLPTMAFGVISIVASLRALEQGSPGWFTAAAAIAIGVLMLLVTAARIASGLSVGSERRRLAMAIATAAREGDLSMMRPNESLTILSTRPVDVFPMVTVLNLGWTQRWPSLWVLEVTSPVACAAPRSEADRRQEQQVRDDLWEDLLRVPPRTIIVQPIRRSMHRREGCLTLADHLARERRFASFFAAYVPSGTIAYGTGAAFTVLRRRDVWQGETSSAEVRR